ncbi:MAG: Hsp20/alpha crystallin family protein [Solirubrobacterales bacterium]
MMTGQRATRAEQAEGARRETLNRQFQPATDIIETADAVILNLDMPGVAKENVDLTVDKDTLTIVGKAQPEETGEAVYRETYVGDYQRQFTLTADVDPNNVAATMNHGVLTVKIGKAEQVKPRKVKIAAAG